MKKITPAILALFLCAWGHLAVAQMASFFPGPGTVHTTGGGGYAGPGDVVSGSTAWGSCARAYNAAYANGTNPICDLKDKTTGTVAICTLRIATTGFADLAGTYCTGSTTPSAACAAAAGGSCIVSKVYDQTGNSNDFTQATLANMPGLVFSALNGLPGLSFNGVSQFLQSTSIVTALPYSFSFVAIRTTFSSNFGVVIASGAGAPFFMFDNSANQIDWAPNGGDVRIAATDNAFHAGQATTNTGTNVVYVDGSSASGATSGSTGTKTFDVGAGGSGTNNQLTGKIMEVGYWPVFFSSGNAGSLNTNQHGSTNGYNF